MSDKKVVIRPHIESYESGKLDDGTRYIDNGDNVGQELRGLVLEEVYGVVGRALKASGKKVTIKGLKEKYEHLNSGMQRMVLGNMLRVLYRKQEEASDDIKKAA